jgi:polygalacturonase
MHLVGVLMLVLAQGTWSQQTCNVMNHGAKGDGGTDDTVAIKAAVAACSSGGTVLLPKGKRFLSYPFNMTSNNMILAVKGDLVGPTFPDLSKWPVLPHFPSYELSRSGHWTRYAPLIGAYNVSNLTITGGGTVDGRGAWWWAKMNTLKSERPRLVEPEWVKGLVVTDITLKQSPYWTLHPIYCEDVTIMNIVITAEHSAASADINDGRPVPPYNTDGIDPDSCSNVRIENYYYCGGDDAVAVKSGWNWAGIQFGMPSKNIYIRNATSGCRGGFTIGSEMSGGVENVTFVDSFSTGQCGMRISSQLGRGGYVRNVRFKNIVFTNFSWPEAKELEHNSDADRGSGAPPTNPHSPFLFHINQKYRPDNPNKTLSFFSNFSFVNLTAVGQEGTQLGDFICLDDSPCKEINVEGLKLSGFQKSPMQCQDVFGSVAGVSGGNVCIKPANEGQQQQY